MTFEEFEQADTQKLRQTAKERFDRSNELGEMYSARPGLLLEAQFYMSEIDRRESSRITRRDFRLELIIIFLIGLEILIGIAGIYFSFKEGKEQAIILERIEKAAMRAGNMNMIRP